MMRSLWFKLVGAFAVVIGVMLAAFLLAVNFITTRQFDLYVTRAGEFWAGRIATLLAEQYAAYGGWDDPQAMLEEPWLMPAAMMSGDGQEMMGPPRPMKGMMEGPPPDESMWGPMGIRLMLVDERGIVVADTAEQLRGQSLSGDVLERGVAIVVDGQQVGTLLAANPERGSPARQSFRSGVGRAIVIAALVAGGFALLFGTLLFQWITSPLRHLQAAAETVASGDLAVRVPVTSRDELGAVGGAFNQMATRLDEQQMLRKQMVADIAHELRTPLSVIQGTLEAMIDGVLKPEPDELSELHGETRRLSRLVEDLRTLSLADAGQLTLRRGPVDVAAFIERLVQQMMPLAEVREIGLQAQVAPQLPAVEADEDRLVQVLTNLIDNALRYAPPGGQVTVRAEQVGEQVQIGVEDNGPGIPAEDLPHIFERFWRGDKSRSRDSGGSGIGLAIVKQLIEMQGGTVSVESQAGKGTAFRVSLPATPR